MKIKLLILLTIIFTANVAFASMEKTMKTIMDSWVGYSIDDVIDQWGYPDKEKNMANRTLDYWYSRDYGGYPCTRILEVNELGKIVSYQWEGVKFLGLSGGCPSYLNLKYKSKWLNQKQNNNVRSSKKIDRNSTENPKPESKTNYTKQVEEMNNYYIKNINEQELTEKIEPLEKKNINQEIKINQEDIIIPQLYLRKDNQ